MAGKRSIRLTKNDRAEHARLSKNTRSKITRTYKNYGIDFSESMKLPPIDSFETREEFNQWKKQMKNFTNRSNTEFQFKKNKYGLVISKKEENEIKRNTKKAQQVAKKKIDEAMKLPFISGGKVVGKVADRVKMMRKEEVAGVSIPVDFNFDNIDSKSRLADRKEQMEERATGEYYEKRDEQMKQNFHDMIERMYNSDADDVLKKLNDINTKDFVELSIIMDEIDFDLFYQEYDGAPSSDKLEILNDALDMYFNGEIDMRLKNF